MVCGESIVDVGTDHAYLPLYLVSSGKCSRAFASDIAEGPLSNAAETIRGYEDSISLVLADGLSGVPEEEVDCVVIAGMGGDMIEHVISGSQWRFEGKTLVLQPMTKLPELCKWLWEAGFSIIDERLSEDAGTLYRAMKAVRAPCEKPEPWELWAGKPLFRRGDPLLARWLDKCIASLRRACGGMKAGGIEPGAELTAALEGLKMKKEELGK